MAAVVVPSAVLVRLIWTLGGTPFAVNVLGGRKTTATTIDQAFTDTLGGNIKVSFAGGTSFNAQISNQVALSKVAVRDISAPNRPEFQDAGAAVAGTSAGNLLPPQVACCVTLRTALAGKSFRGRYYQGGFTVTQNDTNGKIVAAASTALKAFVDAIKTNMATSGLNMAVVSRQQLLATDVTLTQIRDTQWDTIRGRATPGI